ncbi:NfeD family protein [Deltaproteobacteria bacterium OttesenSCG-928-M10]|nr:NfeD family protein [Deltaproteobacteria bacterium OttesenSCG-928-M10]
MEMFGIDASLFWFIVGVALLVLEALTPGFFLVFFGLGAWVTAALVFFLPLGVNIQWIAFMAVSVISLLILRRKLKSLFQGKLAKTDNMDDPVFSGQYIGREVTILKDVGPGEPGLAELNGTNWRARTEGPVLKAGSLAIVERLDGLTLVLAARATPT